MKKKTVLITAGGKRLGKVIAETFINENWSVVLHYNTSKVQAEETAHALNKIGGDVKVLHLNFLDIENTQKFIEKFSRETETWTALINNAGLFVYDDCENFDVDLLKNHMTVNFLIPTFLIKTLYKNLKSNHNYDLGYNIAINILDAKIFGLNPDYYTYTLSKQSMYGLTKLAALSYAPILRVNGIAPGITLPAPGQSIEEFKVSHKKNILRNSSSIEDIQMALKFLIKTKSITGHISLLDGGAHLSPPKRDVAFDF